MLDWEATALGGKGFVLSMASWSGGMTETETPLPGLYTGFNGLLFRSSWPFVLTCNGYVDDNAVGGYRAQVDVTWRALSDQSPQSVTAADVQRVRGLMGALLASSGTSQSYEPASIVAGMRMESDASGDLQAVADLPPRAVGALPGEVSIGFAKGLSPAGGIVDTVRDH
jgi:hypothetical protein